MFETPESESADSVLNTTSNLPVDAIVRTVCEAALAGPEPLYEAMLKLSLAIEALAPTYGLSIWSVGADGPPRVKWAEGLTPAEIDEGEKIVASRMTDEGSRSEINAGDVAICLPLALPSSHRDGAAIYARCIRPLSALQAKSLRSIIGVTQLAHAYATAKADQPTVISIDSSTPTFANLPGMVFSSRAMANVAAAVERVKDSESPVLIMGESGTGKELIARA